MVIGGMHNSTLVEIGCIRLCDCRFLKRADGIGEFAARLGFIPYVAATILVIFLPILDFRFRSFTIEEGIVCGRRLVVIVQRTLLLEHIAALSCTLHKRLVVVLRGVLRFLPPRSHFRPINELGNIDGRRSHEDRSRAPSSSPGEISFRQIELDLLGGADVGGGVLLVRDIGDEGCNFVRVSGLSRDVGLVGDEHALGVAAGGLAELFEIEVREWGVHRFLLLWVRYSEQQMRRYIIMAIRNHAQCW